MSDYIKKQDVLDILYNTFEEYNMATDKQDKLGGFGAEVFKRVKEQPTLDEKEIIRKPMTNADRIRNMTDEELYKFLRYFGVCRICKHRKDEGCDNRGCTQEEVDSFLKEWLQAEAKEGAE